MVVGVPEIVPFEGSIDKPDGKEGLIEIEE